MAAKRRIFLCACLLLAGCSMPPDDAPEDAVRERLVGTWMRDYVDKGTRVRRVLILESEGHFREYSTFQMEGAPEPQATDGEGEWLFDGTNLKRHYRRINGKPLSAPTVPFATFAISFSSRSEFVGVDNIRRLEVRYERVADGTMP